MEMKRAVGHSRQHFHFARALGKSAKIAVSVAGRKGRGGRGSRRCTEGCRKTLCAKGNFVLFMDEANITYIYPSEGMTPGRGSFQMEISGESEWEWRKLLLRPFR